MSAAPMTSDIEQVCTCWVDGQLFGVPVQWVQEVLREQPLTPVPRAPGAVLGLINLRGQIVTAIDLRSCLGLRPRPTGRPAMNIVVRSRGEVVSLVVDDIGDVVPVDAAPVAVPSNVPARIRAVVSGVIGHAGSSLLVLDPDAAIDSPVDTSGGNP
ncbi:chemotaxis protein CheW [Nocardioidaceae bacterium]|nr:chemotaxis protein CheW [Nocardioidaceae bacterium]